MGLIYHFECGNPNCDYKTNIFLGNESYADVPYDVTHVNSIAEYKSYISNSELCPKCDSKLILSSESRIEDN